MNDTREHYHIGQNTCKCGIPFTSYGALVEHVQKECKHGHPSPSQAVGAWCNDCGLFVPLLHTPATARYHEPYYIDGRITPLPPGIPTVDTESGVRIESAHGLSNWISAAQHRSELLDQLLAIEFPEPVNYGDMHYGPPRLVCHCCGNRLSPQGVEAGGDPTEHDVTCPWRRFRVLKP